MIECPLCGRRQQPRLTCESCAAPLGGDLDCFAAFDLPRKLTIDLAALERAYHDLSRRIHPDRFAQSTPRARDASLRSTALLTRSYRTLRDPVARGLYWLELHGQKLADHNKAVPPDMAALVFEVQEELEELRVARGPGVQGLRERTISRRAGLQQAMTALQDDLAANFRRWDECGAQATLTTDLRSVLSRIAYLRTLIRDLERELENLKAA
jgi:molecular chaperone HscB